MELDTEASWHCLTDPAVKDGTCVPRHEPDAHQLIKVQDSYLSIYMTRHEKTTQINMENTELGQFLHIEMWIEIWSNPSMEKLNKTKSSGEIFKTTVYSRLLSTKNSRSLMEKIWKIGISKMFFFLIWKYLCDFCTKILLMYLICAGYYKPTYHVKSKFLLYIMICCTMCKQYTYNNKLINMAQRWNFLWLLNI